MRPGRKRESARNTTVRFALGTAVVLVAVLLGCTGGHRGSRTCTRVGACEDASARDGAAPPMDAAAVDTGSADSATPAMDGGGSDAHVPIRDSGSRDAGPRDSGSRDAGPPPLRDSGPRDAGPSPCTSGPETTIAACTDGCDNEGDGYVDCDDFNCCTVIGLSCSTAFLCGRLGSCTSSTEDTVAACTDGCSNDGDPYEDCDDFDCCGIAGCTTCP